MFGADQIIAHLVGDYIIQSKWMAETKTKSGWRGALAAFIHAVTYTLPFLLITLDPWALSFIALTHYVIDRTRVARVVVWMKNWIGPPDCNLAWDYCKTAGVYDSEAEKAPWLHFWLLIIADNTLHLLCNGFAIWWVGQ